MQYRFMGNTGLKVSELCLGAMTFGDSSQGLFNLPSIKEEEEVFKIINRFAEKGGNFIDTANIYNNGQSEICVGKWLTTKSRDDFVIATKARFPTGTGPNNSGLSRKHILASVEASLKRLQTNYIDLYQVHGFDVGTPLQETIVTLHELVRAGKIRYIGASNFSGYQLQKSIDISQSLGLEPFTCLQPLYNLLCRSTEWELIPVCTNEGVGIIPYSPLSGGMLTGKYSRDSPPEKGSRLDWADSSTRSQRSGYKAQSKDSTWDIVDTVKAIAVESNKTAAQVAIRWLLQKPSVTAPIIGAKSLDQLDANMGAVGWSLTDDQMKKLDEVSSIPLPYPYNFPVVDARKH